MFQFTNSTTKRMIILTISIYSGAILYYKWDNSMMVADMSGAFFSGAASLDSSLKWNINLGEIDHFWDLDIDQKNTYRFKKSNKEDLVPYSFPLNGGLLFPIWLARHIFFWTSDAQALRFFHLAMHLILSLVLLSSFSDFRMKCLFWIFFTVNPYIFQLAIFPFYYFWQEVPSFWLLIRYFAKEKRAAVIDGLSPFVFFLSVITRPTSLFICFLYYAYALFQKNKSRTSIFLMLFLALFIGSKSQNQNYSHPWHTAYIGIGAYSNPQGIVFKDKSGYDKMLEKTGSHYSTAVTGHVEADFNSRARYMSVIKDEYMIILKEHPVMILRNAFFNYMLSFSAGYLGYQSIKTWISIILGVCIICFFISQRAYFWLVALTLAGITFIFYTPPQPSYLFGNYVLTTTGVLYTLFHNKWFIERLKPLQNLA